MRRSRLKRGLLFAGLALGMSGFAWQTTVANAAGEKLSDADPSLGVTYVRNEKGEISAINLNGNSVIIKKTDSTDEKLASYYNIFIDANKNGKVDAGEKVVELIEKEGESASKDLMQAPIYGVYEQNATEDMQIVVEDGVVVPQLFGAYEGGEKDITIINRGRVNTLMGAYKSVVDGNVSIQNENYADTLMAINNSSGQGSITGNVTVDNPGTCGVLFGVMNGSIVGNVQITNQGEVKSVTYGSQDANVAGDILITSTTNSSNTIGAYAGTVKGNVNVTCKRSGEIGQMTYHLCGTEGANVTGNVEVIAENGIIQEAYGVNGGTLDGKVKLVVNKCEVSSYVTAAYNTTVNDMDSDLADQSAVTLRVTDTTIKSNKNRASSCSAVDATTVKSDAATAVKVEVDSVNFSTTAHFVYASNIEATSKDAYALNLVQKGEMEQSYSSYNIYNNGSAPLELKGNVSIAYEDVSSSKNNNISLFPIYGQLHVTGDFDLCVNRSDIYSQYLVSNLNVDGNVNVTMDEDSCNHYGTYYGVYNCGIGGDCIIDIQCKKKPRYSAQLTGIQNSKVTGDAKVLVANGEYEYGISGITNQSQVGGNTTVSIENVKTRSDIKGIYGGNYANDVSVTIKDITYTYSANCYGIDSAKIAGKCLTSIENIKGKMYYFYPHKGCSVGGATTIKMSCEKSDTVNVSYACAINNEYGTSHYGDDVTIDVANLITDSSFYSLRGTLQIDGNLKLNVKDCESKAGFALNYNGAMSCPQADITINHVKANDTMYGFYAPFIGKANVEFDGCEFAGSSAYLYSFYQYSSGDASGFDCNMLLKNTKFTASSLQLNNQCSLPGNIYVKIDDTCTLPANYSVQPNNSKYGKTATCIEYDGTYYVGGNY